MVRPSDLLPRSMQLALSGSLTFGEVEHARYKEGKLSESNFPPLWFQCPSLVAMLHSMDFTFPSFLADAILGMY